MLYSFIKIWQKQHIFLLFRFPHAWNQPHARKPLRPYQIMTIHSKRVQTSRPKASVTGTDLQEIASYMLISNYYGNNSYATPPMTREVIVIHLKSLKWLGYEEHSQLIWTAWQRSCITKLNNEVYYVAV